MRAVAEIPLALPAIPQKRYFAIGEVAELCAVKPHVLRYWEQEFPQLKPAKRRGNRRYYQQDDVQMVRRIRALLYDQGFTIGGARLRLKEQGKPDLRQLQTTLHKPAPVEQPVSSTRKHLLGEIRGELEMLLERWPV